MTVSIRLCRDLAGISRTAARLFVATARQATRARGAALVCLGGGKTPLPLYRVLASEPNRTEIDWERIDLFWSDERCVPADHELSNYGAAKSTLIDHVNLRSRNVHRIPCGEDAMQAASAYARTLSNWATPRLAWPRFDIALLGLGADGHVASIFPHSFELPGAPTIAVGATGDDRPTPRVSLASGVLSSSRLIVFMVNGDNKAEILARVLEGPLDPAALPAQRIRPPDGEVIWIVDELAASRLSSGIKDRIVHEAERLA